MTAPHARNRLRVDDATSEDAPAIRAVHIAAFPTEAEANLVDQAAASKADLLSLVVRQEQAVTGHLLVSPITIHPTDERTPWTAAAIAPIAVLPSLQRQGIGSALMHSAIERCRDQGIHAIILLGEPAYYKRFGFKPAHPLGYSCKWDDAAEAFMALELEADATEALGQGHVKWKSVV